MEEHVEHQTYTHLCIFKNTVIQLNGMDCIDQRRALK